MTTEEIYKSISAHMIKGMMIHEQLMNYYNFLGLIGYNKCHEYHFLQETQGYINFKNYIMNHYHKLIPDSKLQNPYVIPQSWFNYQRKDVDVSTKKKAIKEGIDIWIKWETETKQLYEYVYRELINNGDVAFSIELSQYIKDVDYELAQAYQCWLDLKGVDYDMEYILTEQKELQLNYDKKINKIRKERRA